MTPVPEARPEADAGLAAALLAVDPAGLGGAALRAGPGPAREAWLAMLRALLPPATPWRKAPAGIGDEALLGGLDLAATLAGGRRVAQRGLLAGADGGVVLLAMAERLPAATAARLAAVLDAGEVAVERDGFALRRPARLAMVALDEGLAEEERPPAVLLDRLAFHLAPNTPPECAAHPAGIAAARDRLDAVAVPEEVVRALCAAALGLGILSLRAPLLALRAARAAAALAGRAEAGPEEAQLAARLVLAARATAVPEAAAEPPPAPPPGGEPGEAPPEQGDAEAGPGGALQDVVLAAAQAAIPPGLLARLAEGGGKPGAARSAGRAGERRRDPARGRPTGVRPGDLRAGRRLALVETLRAAAPWQPLRQRAEMHGRIQVRREDIRLRRFERRAGTTVIFCVDASGSAALHRLGEAKGAVELLLGECYARRDRVALVAFRGAVADLLLPPTGSLARARRCLAALPGGGGTPLAAGLEAAGALAMAERRSGRTPLLVVMTDGRANIARDGSAPGRAAAEAQALDVARHLRADVQPAGLVIDTAPRPHPLTRLLAEALGLGHLPLPAADPAALSGAVRALAGAAPARAA